MLLLITTQDEWGIADRIEWLWSEQIWMSLSDDKTDTAYNYVFFIFCPCHILWLLMRSMWWNSGSAVTRVENHYVCLLKSMGVLLAVIARSWNHTWEGHNTVMRCEPNRVAHHGVGLSRARLAISKDAGIVTLKSSLQDIGAEIFKNLQWEMTHKTN